MSDRRPIRYTLEALLCAGTAVALYYAFHVEYFRGLIASWMAVNSFDALSLNREAAAERWRQFLLGIACG